MSMYIVGILTLYLIWVSPAWVLCFFLKRGERLVVGSSFVFSLAGDDSEFLYCFQVLYCSPCVGVPELLRVVIGRQCSRFPVDMTYKTSHVVCMLVPL